jgi:hypothetical protein
MNVYSDFTISASGRHVKIFLSIYNFKTWSLTLRTWSLTLRKVHSLRVFENMVLRIFGQKKNEVTGRWRTLHKEELHNLYSSPSIIRIIKSRRMRWAEHVVLMERREMHIVL